MSNVVSGVVELAVWLTTVYAIGFITGYAVRARMGEFTATDLQRVVALLVTFIWVISSAVAIVGTHTTPVFLHGLMGMVAGFLFKGEGDLTVPINIGGN